MKNLHNSKESNNINSKSFRRLVFDELCANFFALSENRNRIKKIKYLNFSGNKSNLIKKKLTF